MKRLTRKKHRLLIEFCFFTAIVSAFLSDKINEHFFWLAFAAAVVVVIAHFSHLNHEGRLEYSDSKNGE